MIILIGKKIREPKKYFWLIMKGSMNRRKKKWFSEKTLKKGP